MKKTTGTSVLFTNLTNKKRYYFKVAAYTTDDGLTSDGLVSDVTSVYFYDLAKPSFTAIVQPTETSVTLSWGKVSGATEYRLFRSEEKYGEYTRVKTVTERSSTHKGLTAGKTYYYKLRACKTIDTGEITYGVFSAPLEVRMLEKTNMFKVERTGSVSAKLNWEVVPGATGYKAYRATELNGTYEEIKAQKSTTFTNTDLTNGRTYYYKVAATKNPSGILHIGPVSKIVSISIYDIAATKITSCAQSGSGKVALVWNEAEGADGYEISIAGNDGVYHTVKRTALTSTTVGSMSDGETYSIRIRAYKMINEKREYGPYSPVVQAELTLGRYAVLHCVVQVERLLRGEVDVLAQGIRLRDRSRRGLHGAVQRTVARPCIPCVEVVGVLGRVGEVELNLDTRAFLVGLVVVVGARCSNSRCAAGQDGGELMTVQR